MIPVRFWWLAFVDWLKRCLGMASSSGSYGAPLERTRGDRYRDPDRGRRFAPSAASMDGVSGQDDE
jgi:hypothetical protein